MHPALVVIDDACNEGMATVKLKKNLMGLLAHNLPAKVSVASPAPTHTPTRLEVEEEWEQSTTQHKH